MRVLIGPELAVVGFYFRVFFFFVFFLLPVPSC